MQTKSLEDKREFTQAAAEDAATVFRRLAEAVKLCLGGEISPMHPASILREYAHARIDLDKNSTALPSGTKRAGL